MSALFIRRPVMTTLVMLAVLVFGAIGFRTLPISNLPHVDFPTISVSASLPGADPETMAQTVATVLERQFTTIAGIDSMNSSSTLGSTHITLQFSLDRNIDAAAQDVQAAISAALPLLPKMPQLPYFRKVNPSAFPIMYLALGSETMPLSQVDEYAETLMAQRISMVDGVAEVDVYGSQKYAVHVQVNPDILAADGIGLDQIAQAIVTGNQKQPTGQFWGPHQIYTVVTNDQLFNAAQYRPLIVGTHNGAPVRLEDVGRVIDSVQNLTVANWCKDGRAIVLAILPQPDVNIVQVIDSVRALLPQLQAQVPGSVYMHVLFDRSTQIRQSVQDVEFTLLLTVVLVVTVIFLFLRNLTATLIPSKALPLSLIG
ncbi:MAG: efflux RND transporter permease subunit, partial [Candidatus Xenobia bacterium]